MRTRCPHCGEQIKVPDGTRAVICNACRRTFNVVTEADTVDGGPAARTQADTVDAAADSTPDVTRADTVDAGMPSSPDVTDADTVDQVAAGPNDPTVSAPGPGALTRVNCPKCHREVMVPIDAVDARCDRCGHVFDTTDSILRSADTLVSEPEPQPEPEDGPTRQALSVLREGLKDRYDVQSFVSRGGMGAVYRARQLRPSREVALKVMLEGAFASRRHRRRFEREAQAVAGLNHPAIVPVYEVGDVGGQPYFTMEFINGESLTSYALGHQLSQEEICRLMVRVCDAVHYAHQHGVIHRDLKPGNILVDELNRPRILDFGLSRPSEDAEAGGTILTRTGDMVGTPRYMSPEQALGRVHDVDERSDVYALGVILYELIVGMLPYPVDHVRGLRLLETFSSADPIAPGAVRTDVPRDLEIILLKAVARERQQRYASAEALAQDLESFLAGRPIAARPATLGYRLNRWAWRHRRVLVPLGAVAAAVLVLGLVFGASLRSLLRQLTTARRSVQDLYASAEEARTDVLALIDQGDWSAASANANWSVKYMPDVGLEDLPVRVRWAAEDEAARRLAAFRAILDAHSYGEARNAAVELVSLGAQMPWRDLSAELREPFAQLEQKCLAHAQDAVDAALDPAEAAAAADAFAAAFPESPGAAELQQRAAAVAAAGPGARAARYREIMDDAVRAHNWPAAEAVVAAAAADTPVHALLGDELTDRLEAIIRPQTAAHLVAGRAIGSGATLVKAVRFSADGNWLAVAPLTGPIRLIDAVGWAAEAELDPGVRVRSLALSVAAGLLAVGCEDGAVRCWQLPAGLPAPALKAADGQLWCVELSSAGDLLLTASARQATLWDLASGSQLGSSGLRGARPAAMAPNGSLVALAGAESSDAATHVWDVASSAHVHALPTPAHPERIAFGHDGRRLGCTTWEGGSGPRTLHVWDARQGDLLLSVPIGRGPVNGLAWSPDDSLVALAVGGVTDKGVQVRDATTGELLWAQAAESGPYALDFSPDGRLLAVGHNDGVVQLWQTAPPEPGTAPPAAESRSVDMPVHGRVESPTLMQ